MFRHCPLAFSWRFAKSEACNKCEISLEQTGGYLEIVGASCVSTKPRVFLTPARRGLGLPFPLAAGGISSVTKSWWLLLQFPAGAEAELGRIESLQTAVKGKLPCSVQLLKRVGKRALLDLREEICTPKNKLKLPFKPYQASQKCNCWLMSCQWKDTI